MTTAPAPTELAVKPYSAETEKWLKQGVRLLSRLQVWVYQQTGGRLMNTYMGSQVGILTTVGCKTGQERSTPLMYTRDGDKVVIIPSRLGMREPPAWQRNIDANPIVKMQIGDDNKEMIARVATPNEEHAYWPKMVELFDEYKACRERTQGIREIPLIVLEPRKIPVKVISNKIVGIIGATGALGKGLAFRCLKSGHRVALGSRDKAKAQETLEKLEADLNLHYTLESNQLRADDIFNVARESDIIIVAVPFAQQESVLQSIKPYVINKTVIDVTVPLSPPEVYKADIPMGVSAGIRAQHILGDRVNVVSAFQNISAPLLYGTDKIVCEVLVTGDDVKACEGVISMAKKMGMNAVYAGSIENSLATEALTSALIHINRHYKVSHAGISVTGLKH